MKCSLRRAIRLILIYSKMEDEYAESTKDAK